MSKPGGLKSSPEELVQRGRFAEALPMLQSKVRHEPSDARYRLLARCYLETGQAVQAVRAVQQIQKKKDEDLQLLGQAFASLGTAEQAVETLQDIDLLHGLASYLLGGRQVSELDPASVEFRSLRAVLEKETGLSGASRQAWRWLEQVYARAAGVSFSLDFQRQPALSAEQKELLRRRGETLRATLKADPQDSQSLQALLETACLLGERGLLRSALEAYPGRGTGAAGRVTEPPGRVVGATGRVTDLPGRATEPPGRVVGATGRVTDPPLQEAAPAWAVWYAFLLERGGGHFDTARAYLDRLEARPEGGWLASKGRGDLELEAKRGKQALAGLRASLAGLRKISSEAALPEDGSPAPLEARCLAERAGVGFALAWAAHLAGDEKAVVPALREGAEAWLAWAAEAGIPALGEYSFHVGGVEFRYPWFYQFLPQVVEWALKEYRAALEPELHGLLLLVNFYYPARPAAGGPQESARRLEQALGLLAPGAAASALAHGALGEALRRGGGEEWAAALEHLLVFWSWACSHGHPFAVDFRMPAAAGAGLRPAPMTDEGRRRLHGMLLRALQAAGEQPECVRRVFLPLFVQAWYPALADGVMGEEIVQAADLLLQAAPEEYEVLRRRALGLDLSGADPAAVEAALLECLDRQAQDAELLRLYARLLSNQGRLIEALGRASQALEAEPDERTRQLFERIRQQVNSQETLTNILSRSPAERWKVLEAEEKSLLAVLLRVGVFENFTHAAEVWGGGVAAVQEGLEKFLEWELALEVGPRDYDQAAVFRIQDTSYLVHGDLLPLALGTPLPLALQVTRLPGVEEEAYARTRPAFRSGLEALVYQALEGLFPAPEYLVAPNIALSGIFDVDTMRLALSEREFNFFLVSPVDLCVLQRSSGKPLAAFEVDSWYHDRTERILPDRIKNKIFNRGGLKLVRLRFRKDTSVEEMRRAIRQALGG
jgi:Flp pilus assembly protein TadD